MGTYTMPLKDVLDLTPDIGLNDYPIFDESYRETLNKKIVDYFWNREIGQETISLFTHQLRVRMNNIMPLYNQHYEASRIKFDPMKTITMENFGTSTSEATNTGTSNSTSASDAKSRAVNSDHPQEMLSATGDYATSGADSFGTTNATSATDNTGTTAQKSNSKGGVQGFQGNPAMVIFQLRATFVNVDMMVISELEDLFMLVWANGDDFTGRNGDGFYGVFPYGFPF